MDIVERLRQYGENDWSMEFDMTEATQEIERLRRDVKEANARAYVMAQEVTFWQDRAAPKEKQ